MTEKTLRLDLDDLAAQLRAAADALTADRYAASEARQREAERVIDYEDIREGMTIEACYSTGTRVRFIATQGCAECWTDPGGCFQINAPGTEGLDPQRIIRLIAPSPVLEQCPECRHGIDEHRGLGTDAGGCDATGCPCLLWPSTIASHMIAQATEARVREILAYDAEHDQYDQYEG